MLQEKPISLNYYERYVMIVTKHSACRRVLEDLLKTLDLNLCIKKFTNPHGAYLEIEHGTPDLIIIDNRIPGVKSSAFIRQIRMLPHCIDVPLIIINDRDINYQLYDAGATDVISWPIDMTECQARCRNLLAMRARQQALEIRADWLEHQLASTACQIRVREQETLARLIKAGEYRDDKTGCHLIRMAKFSRLIAEALGFSENESNEVELAAPMHDIGKIGIPDHILLKPGKLTEQEFETMKNHTQMGYDILKDSPSKYMQLGAVIALGHHERYDGTGYPAKQRGEEIPLVARIVATADVFDALCSIRPYKSAWLTQDATSYLRQQAGRHLDPLCVDAFLDHGATIEEIQSCYLEAS